MEAILSKLIMPDNAAIQQGTAELKEAFNHPGAIPELCTVLTTSTTPQIRQYSALLLRKKLAKGKTWKRFATGDQQTIKAGTISALVNEPEKSVQHAIVQLIGVLAKHEFPKEKWPELMPFIGQCFLNDDKKSLAMFMASALCETSGEVIKARHLSEYALMFGKALTAEADLEVGFYATLAMTHLVPLIGSDDLKLYQPLVGHVTAFIKRLITSGAEDKATQAMEIYDDLFDSEVGIVIPYIKPIIEMCLVIAANPKHDDELRVKAISFIATLTRMKKKTIVKHKLYIQMINVLFPIMCTITTEEEEEDVDDELDSSSPTLCAAQTLDVLAINLPPEKYMSALLAHLQPALDSSDPALLKGAYEALAVSAEGCADHIRNNYLVNFLQYIDTGIKHPVPVVRNAALYALGQFSEYMQPEISEYASSILPVLVTYLDTACAQMQQQGATKTPLGLDRVFYALQIYSENMEKKLVPFLPELMERLLAMISPANNFPMTVKQLAISGIGSVANAVKASMVAYFERIIEPLKSYLQPSDDDEGILLLTQSMDTLGSIARAVGPTNFAPSLAEECCKLGIELMQQHDDPDVRKAAFSLFGAVAFVAKGNMSSVLPGLIDRMLISSTSKEGLSLELKDEDASGLSFEGLSDEEGEEANGDEEISLDADSSIHDNMDNIKAITVENSFKEEKETAIEMLKEMCVSCGPKAFMAFLPRCLEEITVLLEYPHEDIRREAVYAVSRFVAAYYIDLASGVGNIELFNTHASKLVPTLANMVNEDESVDVVVACLDSLGELLKSCKQGIVNIPGHPEEIIQCVHNVMKSKCACMDSDPANESREEDDFEEEEEAEQDEALFQYAGDILSNLGLAFGDPVKFSPYFAGMLPRLLKKTKKRNTTAEKSFAAGSLAECMKPLAGNLDPFINHLVPVFVRLSKDKDDDVRNNAIFGLGELALYGGPTMHGQFSVLLQTLSQLLAEEKAPRVLDQIIGAVSRLILANKALVPLDQVVPVILKHLPLREDFDEYITIFNVIQLLYTDGNVLIRNALSSIIEMSVQLFNTTEEFEREKVIPVMLLTLRQFNADFPDHFMSIISAYSTEQTSALMAQL